LDVLQQISLFVRETGFPVFVAVWLLMRLESSLTAMVKSNDRLREELQKLFLMSDKGQP
jgi:hypothetical protein